MTIVSSWQNSKPLPCFIPYSKAKFACYSRCFLTSYFCIPVSYDEKDIFFCVCVSSWCQKVLQVFIEPFNFSFLGISGWCIDLDYCDIEQFALETNRDHSVVFEIASKYCISDSFLIIVATPFLLSVLAHYSRFNGHLNEICQFWSILVQWYLKCSRSLLPSPV